MSEPTKGGLKPRTSNLLKTILKSITAILLVIIPLYFSARHSGAKVMEKPSMTFSGRVTDNGAKPIQGATVIATKDQSVGEPIRSDSNGQFQVQLPADTQSLRLTVNADGYGPETIQANIHRTGPEEIYMHRLPIPMVKPIPAPLTKSHPEPRPQKADTAPATAPPPIAAPQQPNQGIINNSPNQGIQNNCAPGVIGCDQSIHVNDPPPLPHASISQVPLPAVTRNTQSPNSRDPNFFGEGYLRFNPGTEVTFSVNQIFDNPSFEFACDVPCEITSEWKGRTNGQYFRSEKIEFISQAIATEGLHHRVYFEDKLAPGSFIKLTVRSRSDKPVKVNPDSVMAIQP
jgi:Carboxypeptidase regulatory-like domain